MIPVPGGWLTAADRSHAPAWRLTADTYDGGTRTGSTVLPVTGGTLARVRDQYPRTTLQVRVPATGQPSVPGPELLPYGTRLTLEYRIDRGPWAVMAVLHLMRSTVSRPDGEWALEAVDASALVGEDAICPQRPAPPLDGTILNTVAALIRRTLPAATVTGEGAAVNTAVPADWKADQSPWKCIEVLTELVGATVWVDPQQPWTFHVRPYRDIGTPVDRLAVGATGTTTGYRVFHERTYNAVSARFTHDGGEVWGWWQDNRPDSRLNPARLGHHITLTKSLEGNPTQAQADAAAAAIGARQAGFARTSEYVAIDRPWLEPEDTVTMVTLAASQDVLVTGIRVPLDHGGMSIDLDNPNYVLDQPAATQEA